MKMVKQRNMLPLKIMHYLCCAYHILTITLIDNTEDLDIVMPMYNLLKYSDGIIIETKSMMLMLIIVLQMVNHLNIKQK